jgi:hypothetical protein
MFADIEPGLPSMRAVCARRLRQRRERTPWARY